MDLGNGLGHLTYSTLVHPGDTWDEMWHSLTTYLPRVKARVAPHEPFGVSLRLSAASAERLVAEPAELDRLRRFLADGDMYLYTVNAFPYGPFKGRRVKEQVYEPDWRSDERAWYTMNVATILADVAPEHGVTTLGGRVPVNPSGGLACFGEAIPAQAIAQVCELTWQLRGQATGRQVEGARVGVAVNQGLFGHGSAVVVKA